MSLEGLTEKEQACIKTVLAFDQLFCEYFLEKITVVNCCDLCRLGDDGCCAKCNVEAGCTLVAMYKVMTKFANDTEATVSFM